MVKALSFTLPHLTVDEDILTLIRSSAQTTCYWITQYLLLLRPPAQLRSFSPVRPASIQRTCRATRIHASSYERQMPTSTRWARPLLTASMVGPSLWANFNFVPSANSLVSLGSHAEYLPRTVNVRMQVML